MTLHKLCVLLIAFCFCTCRTKEITTAQQKTEFESSIYTTDIKLETFAKKTNAEFAIVNHIPFDSTGAKVDTAKARKIVWFDGIIGKAILLQPHLTPYGISPGLWNFINLAWLEDGPAGEKPMWELYLHKGVRMSVISKSIDSLLATSEKNLKQIKRTDLR